MRPFAFALLCLVWLSASLLAAPPQPIPPPSTWPRLVEYDKAPTADVLRELSHEAKVRLILDDSIADTVTIRAECKSPLEALQVIIESKGFEMSEAVAAADIFFVSTPETRAKWVRYLDSAAFPAAIARYKHRLYEALRREGFTEQQALTIVTAERTPTVDVPIFKP